MIELFTKTKFDLYKKIQCLPGNKARFDNISANIHPTLQMSIDLVYPLEFNIISGARYQRVATYSVSIPVWSCSGSATRANPKSQICNKYFYWWLEWMELAIHNFFPYKEMCEDSDLLTISIKIPYLMSVKSFISHEIIHVIRTQKVSEKLTLLTHW